MSRGCNLFDKKGILPPQLREQKLFRNEPYKNNTTDKYQLNHLTDGPMGDLDYESNSKDDVCMKKGGTL